VSKSNRGGVETVEFHDRSPTPTRSVERGDVGGVLGGGSPRSTVAPRSDVGAGETVDTLPPDVAAAIEVIAAHQRQREAEARLEELGARAVDVARAYADDQSAPIEARSVAIEQLRKRGIKP